MYAMGQDVVTGRKNERLTLSIASTTKLFTFGMLTDDDYDSIMGKILVQEESDPVQPGTVICITLDEGLDEEKEAN